MWPKPWCLETPREGDLHLAGVLEVFMEVLLELGCTDQKELARQRGVSLTGGGNRVYNSSEAGVTEQSICEDPCGLTPEGPVKAATRGRRVPRWNFILTARETRREICLERKLV